MRKLCMVGVEESFMCGEMATRQHGDDIFPLLILPPSISGTGSKIVGTNIEGEECESDIKEQLKAMILGSPRANA